MRCRLLAAVIAAATALVPVATSATGSWPTYHADQTRSGIANEPPATTETAFWTSGTLDGSVYAEPLYNNGEVIVATQNNSIYGITASSGAIAWGPVHLGAPRTTGFPCGNINPLGITSTPIIDTVTNTLYAVADIQTSASAWHYDLAAINLTTHAVAWQHNVSPTDPDWLDQVQQQRGALNVSQGNIIISWGGLAGDCGLYHGWVEAVPVNGTVPGGGYPFYETDSAAGQREGGIWATGGPAVDPATGSVFVSAGNGSVTSSGAYDYSDSVTSLNGATLARQSFFAPSTWRTDNAADADLGSVSPALVANNEVFIVGKSGVGYLLNRSSLGGIGGQIASQRICPDTNGAAFGAIAYEAPIAYVACTAGITAVQVGATSLQVMWRTNSGAAGPPIISGGLIWASGNGSGGGSTLYALDPSTGVQFASYTMGSMAHFATPTSAGGIIVTAQAAGTSSRVVALHPAPGVTPGTGYVADAYGGVHPFGGAVAVSVTGYWPGRDLVRGMAPRPAAPTSGYVLDAYGGIHEFGGAPHLTGSAYWPGWDIARDIAIGPDGLGGYMLDGYGGVHPFGNAPAVSPTAYWNGWDIARGIVERPDGQSGYVLDGFGGLHPFGVSGSIPATPLVTQYTLGKDRANGIVLRADGTSGYVLDAYGSVNSFGGAPPSSSSPSWPGWDIARDLTLAADGQSGYVVDGWGGIHSWGGSPRSVASAYWRGYDLVRGAA